MPSFPFKSNEKWLNENFRQFQKFVNDNDLTRVKVLTNMWLQDVKQHSFPFSTPEENTLPSAKVCLDKDFEYEELNRKYKDRKEKEIFESLNCKITDILLSPENKSVVSSLKKISASMMTCQKLYAKQFARYNKQEIATFNEIMRLQMNQHKIIEKNLSL